MAGEIKTNWDNPIMSGGPDLAGNQAVDSRSSDPLVDLGGTSALQTFFDKKQVPDPTGQETANSMSGLPGFIHRVETMEQPPEPPALKDRAPGLVDQS